MPHRLPLASYLRHVYTSSMAITKVFRSGNSQAVRIPKKLRFRSQQVEITKRGKEIVLRERPANLAAAFELLTGLSPDFFKGGRRQPKLEKRPGL
jgi:antitoxin VapB